MLGFLCIGAQKAGTTWLHANLRAHPSVHLTDAKEAHYWDGLERGRHTPDLARYLHRFANDGDLISGDFTPAYATLRPDTVKQIAALLPTGKIVFSIRDPVLRAWSAARMFMRQAWIDSTQMSDAWLIELCRCEAFTQRGHYAKTLKIWSRHFAAENILLIDFARMASEPVKLLRELEAFLGLPYAPGWPDGALATQPAFASPSAAMPSTVCDALAQHYSPLNAELVQVLQSGRYQGRVNLEAWQNRWDE